MTFVNRRQLDGPNGTHIRFEDWQPDTEGAPLTPWVVLWRDRGPAEIRFTPEEWEWITGHDRPA